MVVMYVRGQRVGTLFENTDALARFLESGEKVESKTDSGRGLGEFVPQQEPLCPWEPNLTEDEIQRRINEPGGSTLDEFWKRMGVQ